MSDEREHNEQASDCVRRFGPAIKGVKCPICKHYDNAVWLTQREMIEDSQ